MVKIYSYLCRIYKRLKMEKVYMASVVRDYQMYDNCIRNNPWCKNLELKPLDNLKENKYISVRYNEFLDSFEDEGWIILCHEDWRLECDIVPILETLDKNCLWGPIGIFVEEYENSDFLKSFGRVFHCEKDGQKKRLLHGWSDKGRVDTFDCQCIIMHSSLVKKYHLRFDPNLSYDMYVEDFCVAAYEAHSIESHTVGIKCTHFSTGNITERFFQALEYVREKYRNGKKRYATGVGRYNTFGPDNGKPIHTHRKALISHIAFMCLK